MVNKFYFYITKKKVWKKNKQFLFFLSNLERKITLLKDRNNYKILFLTKKKDNDTLSFLEKNKLKKLKRAVIILDHFNDIISAESVLIEIDTMFKN